MPENRWNDAEAARCETDLDLRVYSARLIGSDPGLVLHGGGNVSVKGTVPDLFGEPVETLFVKGSGWDLASIEARGFSPCRLGPLRKMRGLDRLDDRDMVRELRANRLDPSAPDPSVEALLHAFLPHKFIDHTHADAVLAATNQPEGWKLVEKIYGGRVGIVPYIRPGLDLARACAGKFEENPEVEGLILLHHGAFSFGGTARESYDRMIGLAELAEKFIERRKKTGKLGKTKAAPPGFSKGEAARILNGVAGALERRGFRATLVLEDGEGVRGFLADSEGLKKASVGPATPDHTLHVKRLPAPLKIESAESAGEEAGRVIDAYASEYAAYFNRNAARSPEPPAMLDPWPRAFLVPGLGAVCAAESRKGARIVADIARHTMAAIEAAHSIGRWEALTEGHIFDVEYWSLQQSKLKLRPARPPLAGKTAVVTGAGKGIGLAVAARLAEDGANVAALDVDAGAADAALERIGGRCKTGNEAKFIPVDVADRDAVRAACEEAVLWTGRLDVAVSNAGIFPKSASIEDIAAEDWERSVAVNLTGAFNFSAEALRWMKRMGCGGDLIFIASKNAPAPGKKAGAYSVMKAAQTQLARVAALESGEFGIRVNVLHPHLILDTELWSGETLKQRAAAYNMTVEEYRTNNLLKTGLDSNDVAAAVSALVCGAFSKTTGAQIPIDGGSDRTL